MRSMKALVDMVDGVDAVDASLLPLIGQDLSVIIEELTTIRAEGPTTLP